MKKTAFYKVIDDNVNTAEEFRRQNAELNQKMVDMQVAQCRVYLQEVEGRGYLFYFFESEQDVKMEGIPARHVYEFRLHEGDDFSRLKSNGMIIGVAHGKLEEYVRLHDEQPDTIHELCYENGFRKSSIFTVEISPEKYYLLQFVEFEGKENPELYKNPDYQEWLRVTGECQVPLPGERFWKDMQQVYKYKMQPGAELVQDTGADG